MSQLPETGFLRLSQILGNPKKGVPALIPIGKSSWHYGVSNGTFPKPIKLSNRVSVYRVEDIKKLIESGPSSWDLSKPKKNVIDEADYTLEATPLNEVTISF